MSEIVQEGETQISVAAAIKLNEILECLKRSISVRSSKTLA